MYVPDAATLSTALAGSRNTCLIYTAAFGYAAASHSAERSASGPDSFTHGHYTLVHTNLNPHSTHFNANPQGAAARAGPLRPV